MHGVLFYRVAKAAGSIFAGVALSVVVEIVHLLVAYKGTAMLGALRRRWRRRRVLPYNP